MAAGIMIEDVESRIAITISEPLSIIGVIDCSAPPAVSSIRITIYLWADIGERATEFLERSLESCFIYNTMRKSCDIDIRFVMSDQFAHDHLCQHKNGATVRIQRGRSRHFYYISNIKI